MNIPLVDSLSSFFFQAFLWLTHFFPPSYFLSSNCKKCGKTFFLQCYLHFTKFFYLLAIDFKSVLNSVRWGVVTSKKFLHGSSYEISLKSYNLASISRNFPTNVFNNFTKSFVKSKSTFFLSKEHKYWRLTNLVNILAGNIELNSGNSGKWWNQQNTRQKSLIKPMSQNSENKSLKFRFRNIFLWISQTKTEKLCL